MTCNQHDVAPRYVAGRLSDDELEAFEGHLLTCSQCVDSVRAASAVRAAFNTPAPSRTFRPWSRRILGASVLLAATVLLAIQLRQDTTFGALSEFVAPRFEGGAARANADSVAAVVDRAMAAYAARDYQTAASLLSDAAMQDSTPAVAFYLGVARLQTGAERAAAEAFARARYPSGNPYEADARVFGAKAWLRMGERDSALVALGGFVGGDSDAHRLAAFADSIRAMRR